MNFGQALEALNEGKKIKVPEWGGYWFKQSGIIKVMTAEGVVLETPHFQQYIFRQDWEIAEKDNKKDSTVYDLLIKEENDLPISKGYDDKFYIFEGTKKLIYESTDGFEIVKELRHVEKALHKLVKQYPESGKFSLTEPFSENQFIKIENVEDVKGVAPIVKFTIQSDPIREVGINGVQALDMLKYIKCLFESLNEAFPCRENALTITKIEEAIHWQEARTRDRMRRNVEGKNKA
jgi:hypothetical protein